MSNDQLSKEELREQLDARGIEYDARLGADKLAALLEEAETPAEEPTELEDGTNESEGEQDDEAKERDSAPSDPEPEEDEDFDASGSWVVTSNLKCDGVLYEPGAEFAGSDERVEELAEAGVIERAQ